MEDSLRQAKEAFVTGHHGTDPWNVIYITLVVPFVAIASSYVSILIHNFKLSRMILPDSSISNTIDLIHLLVDFILVAIPALVISIDHTYLHFLLPVLSFISLTSYICNKLIIKGVHHRNKVDPSSKEMHVSKYTIPISTEQYKTLSTKIHTSTTSSLHLSSSSPPTTYATLSYISPSLSRLTPITRVRAGLLLLTAVSILAVDFPLYPRFNAKTEFFGLGLMDMGVGAFVFFNAITAPITRLSLLKIERLLHTQSNNLQQQGAKTSSTLSPLSSSPPCLWRGYKCIISSLIRAQRSLLPVAALSVIRPLAMIGANYQQHVSEYGVHWSFFTSLLVIMTVLNVWQAVVQFLIVSLVYFFNVDLSHFSKSSTSISTFTSSSTPSTSSHDSTFTSPSPSSFTVKLLSNILYLTIVLPALLSPLLLIAFEHAIWPLLNIFFFSKRSSWINANREGVVSLVGYSVVAIVACAIGFIMQQNASNLSSSQSDSQSPPSHSPHSTHSHSESHSSPSHSHSESYTLSPATRVSRKHFKLVSVVLGVMTTLLLLTVPLTPFKYSDYTQSNPIPSHLISSHHVSSDPSSIPSTSSSETSETPLVGITISTSESESESESESVCHIPPTTVLFDLDKLASQPSFSPLQLQLRTYISQGIVYLSPFITQISSLLPSNFIPFNSLSLTISSDVSDQLNTLRFNTFPSIINTYVLGCHPLSHTSISLISPISLLPQSASELPLPVLPPISRRLANSSFSLLILTSCMLLVLIALLPDLLQPQILYISAIAQSLSEKISLPPLSPSISMKIYIGPILHSLDSHAFAFFLITNLLTGFVNFVMTTLYTDDYTAFAVMVAYLSVSCMGLSFVMNLIKSCVRKIGSGSK